MYSSRIINEKDLAKSKERMDLLDIGNYGLHAIDTRNIIKKKFILNGDTLTIEDKVFNLKDYEKIVVFTVGKASIKASQALEEILGDKISFGIGIDKDNFEGNKIKVYKGDHPLPSKYNVSISSKIKDEAEALTDKDLAIVVISGGGSSLLCYPIEECDQENILYEKFLSSGGSVIELNTIRKHISSIKGGGLAKFLYPATVASLILCDVPGDHFHDVASGPTYKDTSNIEDAKKILEKYKIPNDFNLVETPKEEKYFEKVFNFEILSNTIALEKMKEKSEELGYSAVIMGSEFYEDEETLVNEIFDKAKENTILLIGGEPSLNIHGKKGSGGRNEMMSLFTISKLTSLDTFMSLASDGIDNKSEYAGAIVDYSTKRYFLNNKDKLDIALENMDPEPLLLESNDLIKTGETESNVSDLYLFLRKKNISTQIKNVTALEIEDSRNKKTIKVVIEAGDKDGSFSVPSGASTGKKEALELRDKDGKMSKAINNVNSIAKELVGHDVCFQRGIDNLLLSLDNTPQKEKLGGNTTIGISIACAKVAAKLEEKELFLYLRTLKKIKSDRVFPYLYVNLINGGKHATSPLAFQEYHIVPQTNNYNEAFLIINNVITELEKIIKERSIPIVKGDEGGYVLPFDDVFLPLHILKEACIRSKVLDKVKFALDIAASSFFDKDKNKYLIGKEYKNRDDLITIYKKIVNEFDVLSIEDPFYEEDFESFTLLRKSFPDLIVVGDDLTVTNSKIIKEASDKGSINAVIIKPNQIGTLSETLEAMDVACENNIHCIVSHRSGETIDDFISDLAMAFNVFGIKIGSPKAKERMVKYKRLEEIFNLQK